MNKINPKHLGSNFDDFLDKIEILTKQCNHLSDKLYKSDQRNIQFAMDQQKLTEELQNTKNELKTTKKSHIDDTKNNQYIQKENPDIKKEQKKEIVKNVTLQTKLDLFSNYFHNPENIDVDWNFMLNMKVNEWLSANLITQLIYDDDVKIQDPETSKSAPMVQFMEMFGVGLSFKF